MIRLVLTEHRTTYGVTLSAGTREALRLVHPGMRLEPSPASSEKFDLTPDQRIGLIVLPDLTIEIRPKIPMARAVFLISYACGAARWSDNDTDLSSSDDLCELMGVLLAHSVERAARGGLLCGYHAVDEALPAPRGRIDFDTYICRRLAMSPPIDVRHDLFSSDVIENQLLLAGLLAFRGLRLRSRVATQRLQRAERALGGVSRREFHRSRVPIVTFTRLNRHYQAPIELARLVLQSSSTDLAAGGPRAATFLIDLNVVFEQFVRRALRDELEQHGLRFPDRPPTVSLDRADQIPLRPDLAALRAGEVLWLGDAKYKRLPAGAYLNADIYQMIAYMVGHELGSGTLIYAADDGVSSATHRIRHLRRDVHVRALDLAAPPRSLLCQIRSLAEEVLRSESLSHIAPAASRMRSRTSN